MPGENPNSLNIVSLLNELGNHPDVITDLGFEQEQVVNALTQLRNVVERAMELEDRRLLHACSLLGLLENKDARTGQVLL